MKKFVSLLAAACIFCLVFSAALAEEDIPVQTEFNLEQYTAEELVIAFNYKFVMDALKIIESDEVIIGLNASLSATVLKPNSEEDFICLIMPVQIR